MKIFNTLTRQKDEFVPVEEGKVKIYACGPTVYNFIHIGNARPLCVFDVLRRYLEWRGYDVTFVQNFTDIDDKLIKKANEEGITVPEVAERYIKNLDGVEGVKPWKPQESVEHNYAYFPVVFDADKFGKNRDEIANTLGENGVFARKYFYPLTSEFDCYKGMFEIQKTPVAKEVASKVLTLPLYADLALEDVDKICELILK